MLKHEQQLAKLLTQHQLTLSIAESCTGGLLSHRLTNIPGSSAFLLLSIIAYDNRAKSALLKVSPAILKKYGAVSQPAAQAMAHGISRIVKTPLSVAITGIAGPGGGSPLKPVGTVFIAVKWQKTITCYHCQFKGSRLAIKNQAANFALKKLIQLVK